MTNSSGFFLNFFLTSVTFKKKPANYSRRPKLKNHIPFTSLVYRLQIFLIYFYDLTTFYFVYLINIKFKTYFKYSHYPIDY